MNKKLTMLMVSPALAALIALTGGLAQAASVHCVPDASVDASCGDVHASIQAAVDDASGGDTVLVGSGTYDKVDIASGKDGLILESASMPVIDCFGVTGGAPVGNGITIGSANVTIRGFEIKNCTNGIASVGSLSEALIEKNDVHDNKNPAGGFGGVGIVILGDGGNVDNTVTKNKVHDNDRQGIFLGRGCSSGLHDSMYNTISKNTIFDNGKDLATSSPDASQYGIQLCEASDNTISRNQISNHNSWGFGAGIYLFDSSDNTVSQNKLDNNRQGIILFAGGLIGSFDNTIERNKITNGVAPAFSFSFPATAIRIFDAISDDNMFSRNSAINNAGDGFRVGAGDNTFTRNKSENNAGFGFVEPTAPGVSQYTKNSCENNGLGGSSTDGGTTATGGLCGPQL